MSTFSGLSTALSALFAQRRGLDVTGQNVANANTEGYSRQRVTFDSVGPPTTPAFFSTYEGAGGGVTVDDVRRLRDTFLELRAQTEHGRSGFLSERRDALRQVEALLAEPGSTGIAAQLSEFWRSWHDVANRPGDAAARSQLLQRGNTLTDSIGKTYAAFEAQWNAARTQLETVATEVNTTAAAVAELNLAIRRDTQAGIPTNELSDRRDLLVLKLADMVGVSSRGGEDGTIDVYLGGTALVRGATSETLQVSGAPQLASVTAASPIYVSLTWANDGYPVTVGGGRAAGLLDTVNAVLPEYATKLDAFAASLAGQVNGAHASGWGLDGNTGRNFFTGSTAATIRTAFSDVRFVAASGIGPTPPPPPPAPAPAPGNLDGSKATQVAALGIAATGPDIAYRTLVVELGVQTQTAIRRTETQSSITVALDASRDAAAGVDVDEEMVNMLAFQRAYEGAARLLTAVDEALDTLINRTGLVGR